MRPETEPWWRQAQADVETAEVALQGGRFYAVSWFAQQAAEKALKALYLERQGRLAPRTHDLRYLGSLLTVPQTVETDLDALTPAFDLARYPDPIGTAPVDAVDAADATIHLEAARRTLAWIGAQL
jgi:HEPN domain-containing protein